MIFGIELFFSLFNNLAIFIALVTLYGYLLRQLKRAIWYRRQTLFGLSFGVFAIGCMYAKIPVFEGVIVDQRNAIIALSGAFGGPISAIISASLAGSYRIYLGGSGAFAGVVGVFLSAIAGIVLNRFPKGFRSIQSAAISALFATLIILPGFLFVKDIQTGLELLKEMSLPYGLAIFCGIFLVGLLLNKEEERFSFEQSFKESEERYRTFHNISFSGLFIHDQGIILDCNQGLSIITGYTLEEMIGMDGFKFIAPVWIKEVMQKIRSGSDQPYEVDGIRKDGTIYPLYVRGKTVPYKGRLVRAVEYRDLTEKKLVEEALKQNYIQLKAIYNTLPVIIWALDEKGIFTLSEGKELHALGLNPGQVVGMSAFDIYKDNPLIIEKIKKSLAGEFCEYESDVMGAFYHSVLTPFFDEKNRVLGLNGLAINITEKRKVEKELNTLRNYLSNIIDSMPSLIIGVDPNGSVTQWNKMVEKTTGITAEEAWGKTIFDLLPQMALEKDKISQSIQTRQVIQEQKRIFETKNGISYEDLTIYPLITNGVEGAVIRIDDVTDKVRLEETMIQNEKMLSLGGLAAGMAHEINNPLAGVIQNANVLTNRLTNCEIPANIKAAKSFGTTMESIQGFMNERNIPRMIKAITDSGLRMASIVENMLSFARKGDSSFSSHDPVALMDKSLVLAGTDYDLKKEYDFKSIQIQKEYEENLPMIACEGNKIQQVFLNLLNNGAHAMFARGKSEEIQNPKFILRLSHKTEIDMLQIEIEDNGTGIDKTTRQRIFEPFFTTKPVGIGTGLGLSVSYFIITENHKGTIEVVSEPAKRTNFIIRLPLGRKIKTDSKDS